MRFPFAAGLCALAAISACSLLTDLDGNAGGVRDVDAGGVDVAVPDAGDGSALLDDASDSASSPPDGGCAPGYTIAFCDDFERSQPLGKFWDTVDLSGSGTIAVSNGALEASTGAATSGDEGRAALRKTLTKEVGRVLVEVRLQFDALPALDNEYRLLWGMTFKSAAGSQLLYFSAYAGKMALVFQDQTVQAPYPLSYHQLTLPPGPTYSVRAEVAVGGRTALFVDGVKVIDIATPAFLKRGEPSFGLGILSSPQPTSAFAVVEDDFVFGAD